MPTRQATKSKYQSRNEDKVWSDVEQAAMKESARERKSQAKRSPAEERAAGEAEVQAKFAEMPPDERAIAMRIHEIVAEAAPDLVPRTYYGMPAYALNGKVICFFQPASKFKVRYNTFGFQPDAKLDDGDMWPNAFAVTRLTPAVEQRVSELLTKAVG
jgi:uncharacterized protein YdhG (YjbR/CyaY superfamily)